MLLCLLVDERLQALGAGPCTVTASQPGDADWAPAEPVSRTLRIARGEQTIDVGPTPDTVFGAEPAELVAASNLSRMAAEFGDFETARTLMRRVRDEGESVGAPHLRPNAVTALAEVEYLAGDEDEGRRADEGETGRDHHRECPLGDQRQAEVANRQGEADQDRAPDGDQRSPASGRHAGEDPRFHYL